MTTVNTAFTLPSSPPPPTSTTIKSKSKPTTNDRQTSDNYDDDNHNNNGDDLSIISSISSSSKLNHSVNHLILRCKLWLYPLIITAIRIVSPSTSANSSPSTSDSSSCSSSHKPTPASSSSSSSLASLSFPVSILLLLRIKDNLVIVGTLINGSLLTIFCYHHHRLVLILFVFYVVVVVGNGGGGTVEQSSLDQQSTTDTGQSRKPEVKLRQIQIRSTNDHDHSNNNYIEYNLADYCTEETWSDYPGRHLIRLEKSLKIRLPSILDFQFNETHRHRFGFFNPGPYPNPNPQSSLSGDVNNHNHNQRGRPSFVPYCLLSFSVEHGHRIYAEGLATGLITGGKEWFTETLHFKNNNFNMLKHKDNDNNKGNQQQPEIGTFAISTTKNSLTLIFEQLHLGPFTIHLILTPFRDAKTVNYVFGCESDYEYQCNNQRCIARYLQCDHHNNCGDYSDEALNCLARISTRPDGGSGSPGIGGPDDRRPSFGRIPQPQPPQSSYPTEVPTFPIDPNRSREEGEYDGGGDGDNEIPEYVDVPFPIDTGIGGRTRTSTINPSFVNKHKKPINGLHTSGSGSGGFLEDLFRFNRERTSNVVKVVRYLLALLVIIILVTLINFLIWCLITKRDQSFMATTATQTTTTTAGTGTTSAGTSEQSPQPPISIIAI